MVNKKKKSKRVGLATKSKMRRARLAESDFSVGMKPNTQEQGSSGTDIVGGFLREEKLQELQGPKGAEKYDDMRRRESVVAMLLSAIKNPIMAANWSVSVKDEHEEMQQKMKALVEWNLFSALDDGWRQFLGEVLTFVEFGYSVFECITATKQVPELAQVEMPEDPLDPEDDLEDEAQLADPAAVVDPEDAASETDSAPLVTYFRRFAFRKQATIWRWNLDRATGKILSVTQQTVGDTSKKTTVDISGQTLLVFTHQKEGDNYEGISTLRPMYGAYKRKDLYLRLTAIGAEKNAVGTPIGTMPAGKGTKSSEKEIFEEVLEKYSGNESSYVLIPQGYDIKIEWGQFDPQKMATLLNFEDEQMCKAVMASFLSLGTGGNSGSLAVGGTLSNFFLAGIQALADVAVNQINTQVIPAICQMTYGPQPCYPKISCTGINDKAGKELSDIILSLTQAQALTPDSPLEDFLRQQYKLTKQDPATARKKPSPAPVSPIDPSGTTDGSPKDPSPGADKAKDRASLAEKKSLHLADYKKQFDKNKEDTKKLMREQLSAIAADFVKRVRKNYDNLPDSQKVNAVKGVSPSSKLIKDYKDSLREIMANVSTEAIAQARKEVPKAARDVKFGAYDRLNPLVKRAIESQLGLVVDTQVADMAKVVLFQWSSSASSSDNADAIENDVMERLKPSLEGTSNAGFSIDAASGDVVAHVTQNSRNEFFFSPEVLDTLESFTFTNEDPISEICQNLNGQTFSVSDPSAEQFYPPLHHNCKSRLVPNEKGSGEEITGISINAPTTDERQRLEKQITLCDCNGHKLFS